MCKYKWGRPDGCTHCWLRIEYCRNARSRTGRPNRDVVAIEKWFYNERQYNDFYDQPWNKAKRDYMADCPDFEMIIVEMTDGDGRCHLWRGEGVCNGRRVDRETESSASRFTRTVRIPDDDDCDTKIEQDSGESGWYWYERDGQCLGEFIHETRDNGEPKQDRRGHEEWVEYSRANGRECGRANYDIDMGALDNRMSGRGRER